jgi:hypothetical protein
MHPIICPILVMGVQHKTYFILKLVEATVFEIETKR